MAATDACNNKRDVGSGVYVRSVPRLYDDLGKSLEAAVNQKSRRLV
jgi:hypothetical protein